MRREIVGLVATALALGLAGSTPACAGDRKAPNKATCARASYPGDPVCDIAGETERLPTPSSRHTRPAREESGFKLGNGVTIDGKTNFNENRYGAAPLDKLEQPRSRKSLNAGPQLDFKF